MSGLGKVLVSVGLLMRLYDTMCIGIIGTVITDNDCIPLRSSMDKVGTHQVFIATSLVFNLQILPRPCKIMLCMIHDHHIYGAGSEKSYFASAAENAIRVN